MDIALQLGCLLDSGPDKQNQALVLFCHCPGASWWWPTWTSAGWVFQKQAHLVESTLCLFTLGATAIWYLPSLVSLLVKEGSVRRVDEGFCPQARTGP